MTRNIFKLIFRLIVIASVVVGICLTPAIRQAEQFWFFTIQTNIFIAIIELILVVCQILNFLKIETNFIQGKTFSFIRTLTTFFITITGLIYCFVLAPAGVYFDGEPLSKLFDARNILLHVTVPAMAILDHLLYCKKGNLKFRYAPIFLIYPIIYFAMVNFRVLFGGAPFSNGSLYPYFFLDPYLDAQGWGMVAIYLAFICLLFYGLACLYIWLDKKLSKRKQHLD